MRKETIKTTRGFKIFKRIALVFTATLLLLMVIATLFINHVIKHGVARTAPLVLGVPVTVDKVNVNLWKGRVTVRGLSIGNPEGFSTNAMFRMGHFFVDVNVASVFHSSRPIRINEIIIDAPVISYETGTIRKSNIDTFLERLQSDKKSEGPTRKVIISKLSFTNGEIHYRHSLLTVGASVPIPLPSLYLTDIGEKSGGATVFDVTLEVFKSIGRGIGSAVVGVASSIGSGIGSVVSGVTSLFSSSDSESTNSVKQTK